MTLKQPDQEAIAHGRISEKPLRDKPSIPSWVLKLTMAVTGLLFTLFVIGHMAGNLKLYAPATEDGAALDVYGRFLRSAGEPLLPENALLWIVRIVLLAALVAHILAAIMLYQRSGQSRGKFKRTNLMGGMDSFATRSMLVTGIVLLCFIVFHLLDLTMGVQPVASDAFVEGAVRNNMIATFSRWPVTIFYVIAMLCLFLHLTHGIKLAASDLGITGKKWRQTFIVLAYVIPLIVVIGNIVMPLSIATGLVS
ncbi:succinate dehydrogenase cytochrome b subunit [Corynebacterium massiliense]|uniref:Succinate dehydrogenase/Fumarate reductase transmembrane subunit n=1 Tax=Corynebacterium massiliense DSM 45435 TaxID=1121364 RepID=A0ABY7U6U5_9CORY|nr:succinate dehydrogenase cytochrome b subunit [Corynebacterium massiliense]WCZ31694.1 Succinate dehydrogenase/Fumarate reductase transmembrane subunit [Corynebacterium massiliense DSM 45435]